MSSRLGFDFTFATSSAARPRGAGATLRFLFIADFVGESRTTWPLRKVDVDNLEALIAAVAPQIRVPASSGKGETQLSITGLDDFHPDHLLQSAAPLSALLATRQELAHPATFAAAAARLRASSPSGPLGSSGTSTPAAANESSLLSSLLGGQVKATPRPAQDADAFVAALVKEAVASAVVPDRAPEQAALVAAVEESLAEELRYLLHAPAFARVESAWRGLERMIDAIPPDASIELWLCSLPPLAMLHDLVARSAEGRDLGGSLLAEVLEGPNAPPFSALVVDEAFGQDAESLLALSALAAVAGRVGAAVLATAAPALVGASWPSEPVLPSAVGPHGDAQAEATYALLRQSPLARNVGLVFPRWLLRLPYGHRRNEVQAFAFDELGTAKTPPTDRLSWGGGGLAAATGLAVAFAEDGSPASLGEAAVVKDAAVFTYLDALGERQLFPATGAWLSEAQALAVLARGIMPLVAHRQLAQASLLRVQSLAEPAAPLDLRLV